MRTSQDFELRGETTNSWSADHWSELKSGSYHLTGVCLSISLSNIKKHIYNTHTVTMPVPDHHKNHILSICQLMWSLCHWSVSHAMAAECQLAGLCARMDCIRVSIHTEPLAVWAYQVDHLMFPEYWWISFIWKLSTVPLNKPISGIREQGWNEHKKRNALGGRQSTWNQIISHPSFEHQKTTFSSYHNHSL